MKHKFADFKVIFNSSSVDYRRHIIALSMASAPHQFHVSSLIVTDPHLVHVVEIPSSETRPFTVFKVKVSNFEFHLFRQCHPDEYMLIFQEIETYTSFGRDKKRNKQTSQRIPSVSLGTDVKLWAKNHPEEKRTGIIEQSWSRWVPLLLT